MHLVNWNQLSKPKEFEGVGARKMKPMNEALIMKLYWGMLAKPKVLWVQILRRKYCRGGDLCFESRHTTKTSPLSWAMCKC